MAFPAVVTTATTLGTTATGSPVLNLPASIVAGNTLIAWFRHAVSAPLNNMTWPAGWTELYDDAPGSGIDQVSIAWRKADGAEGATITVTLTNSAKFAALIYQISGATDPTVTAPERSTVATGNSTTPDPTTCTPTGGAKDYLWLWLGSWEGEQTSPPASTPTNYTNALGADSGTVGAITTNCRVASAQRELNAASEDAGSWTISVADDWAAFVVAVHPATLALTAAQMAGLLQPASLDEQLTDAA